MNRLFVFRRNGFTIIKRWLTGCLFLFFVSCQDHFQHETATGLAPAALQEHYSRVDSVKPLAESGDLIFRNGTDEVSAAARSMNRIDTSFSHCGLVMRENDTVFVYHAIGGSYNPSQKLRRDPIDSFLVPQEANRFALYRYTMTDPERDSLMVLIRNYHKAGLKFDLFFNFQSDEEMYCSEFVFKCLNKALGGALGKIIAAREWPYGISPDDLFLNERSRLIKRVDFTLQ